MKSILILAISLGLCTLNAKAQQVVVSSSHQEEDARNQAAFEESLTWQLKRILAVQAELRDRLKQQYLDIRPLPQPSLAMYDWEMDRNNPRIGVNDPVKDGHAKAQGKQQK
jgi:hypothetical protein